MDVVIDANILFAVLIAQGKNEELLFQEDMHVFAPEFLFEELERYISVILNKTKRTEEELDTLLLILKKRIKTIGNEETDRFVKEAETICPDPDDVDYFALALKLNCAI